MTVDVRRAADRRTTRTDWLESRHSFAFGQHYDPGNTGFGLLLVSNDDVVTPGAGFPAHPHRDMEIVTWVLEGELAHQDDRGHVGVITPGVAQRMSAGTGILHSERNARDDVPVRFVQMWVVPDTAGVDPSYAQQGVDLVRGELVPVASGREPDAAVALHQRDATLWAARLEPGTSVVLPDAPFVHLYVCRGTGDLEGAVTLAEGDAARIAGEGGRRLTAATAAEVLVWEMHGGATSG